MKQAFDTICRDLTGYGINDLNVRTRNSPIVQARKKMCIHLHENKRLSYRTIADIVGWNGDHTIVCKTIKEHNNPTI